jgi:hypothetical protein
MGCLVIIVTIFPVTPRLVNGGVRGQQRVPARFFQCADGVAGSELLFRQSNQGLDHRVIIPFGCFGPQKIPFSGSSS